VGLSGVPQAMKGRLWTVMGRFQLMMIQSAPLSDALKNWISSGSY
jgi:hypothetical protein